MVNLVVSTELSTFNSLEVQRKTFNGPLEENSPSGTDLDEYKRWMDNGGKGVGDIIYDDPDDQLDAAEFERLRSGDATD